MPPPPTVGPAVLGGLLPERGDQLRSEVDTTGLFFRRVTLAIGAAVEHDGEVKYAEEPLRAAALEHWTARKNGHFVEVGGPCPTCHGTAWGPALPVLATIATRVVGVLPLDGGEAVSVLHIEAECHCGFEHGHAGATGCGRYWVVPVTER